MKLKKKSGAMEKKSEASAFNAFEDALKALQHEGILMKGGLSAYVIYVIAILVVFFLVLQIFVDFADITVRIMTLSIPVLVAGVFAGMWNEYLKFRKDETTANLRGESLRLKVELATNRGEAIINFFRFWAESNPAGFATIMGQDFKLLTGLLNDLDAVYAELGLDEARFNNLRAAVDELKRNGE